MPAFDVLFVHSRLPKLLHGIVDLLGNNVKKEKVKLVESYIFFLGRIIFTNCR